MNANAFQTAAELIAFHGQEDAVRIAADQVKRHARNVTVQTVDAVQFWAEVMARAAGLALAPAELHHLRSACSRERCAVILRLSGGPTSKAA